MIQTGIRRFAKRVLPQSVIRLLRGRSTGPEGGVRSRRGHDSRERDPHADLDVDHLEDRLWLGYETAAVAKLSELTQTVSVEPSVRSRAALALARWAMTRGEYELALGHIDLSTTAKEEVYLEAASLAADCLCCLGRGREALSRLSPLLDRREADSSTSIRVGSARSLAEMERSHGSGPFIEALNRLYVHAGLVPVSRRDVLTHADIDNLAGTAPTFEPAEAAALISVVVPAYNAEATISATIESLCAQSWKNLEIVVVDDCSLDGTADAVRSLMRKDTRIRFVQNRVNRGPYSSRSIGLGESKGEYITVHHANEWSHPQRIEMQANALTLSPSVAATGSSRVKVGEHFVHRPVQVGDDPSLVSRNVNSLMVRRSVFDQIGVWDVTSGPADEEFSERVQARFGREAVEWIEPDTPLSIVKDTRDLSDTTFARMKLNALGGGPQYRAAFRWWHGSPGFRSSLPYRPDIDARPFAAPVHAGEPAASSKNHRFPLVVIGDLADNDHSTNPVLSLIDRNDDTVGLVHIPAFDSHSRSPSAAFQSLAASGHVTMLGLRSAAHCRMLLVIPSILSSPWFDHLPAVTAEEAYVWRPATAPPLQTDLADLEKWARTSFRIVGDPDEMAGVTPW